MKIKTLEDLIASGFDEDALENSECIYIWPITSDPDSDSELYKFNKESKTLEWVPGFISVVDEINIAKDVKINAEYLKQYL